MTFWCVDRPLSRIDWGRLSRRRMRFARDFRGTSFAVDMGTATHSQLEGDLCV
jgi:hypothetical protein